jgi:hypothetical protein
LAASRGAIMMPHMRSTAIPDNGIEPPYNSIPQPIGLRAGIDPGHLSRRVREAESGAFVARSLGRTCGSAQAEPPVAS